MKIQGKKKDVLIFHKLIGIAIGHQTKAQLKNDDDEQTPDEPCSFQVS
jgi:hypothetical protein